MALFFRHHGIDFCYEVIGEGRPLVFCHGLTGDLSQPRQLIGEVPSGWRLIVWDARLHGSTRPDSAADDLSFSRFSDDLAALLDHCGIDSAVIGGISMGAGVAARFAADYPKRTQALVLVRPAWIDQPRPPNLLLVEQAGARLGEMDGEELWRRFEADPALVPAARESSALRESLRQLCIQPLARERSLRLRAMPASAPLRQQDLPRLKMPALIVGNELDLIHPYSLAEWWASALGSNAVLHKVPSKSVDMHLHQRETRRHILRFLASQERAFHTGS